MKFLGVDYGNSMIGLAIGDDESYLAVPYDTIYEKNFERQLGAVRQIVLDEDIDVVVVGHPLSLTGDESEQTAETVDFVDDLSGRLSVPVHLEDERLTSQHAKVLKEQDPENTYDIHAYAAVSILQGYLDRISTK